MSRTSWIGDLVGREGADLDRLLNVRNVPVGTRAIQVANALMTPLLCGPLGISHVVEYPKCGGSWIRDSILAYTDHPRNNNERLLRRGDVLHGHRLYRRSYRRPIVVVRDPRDMLVSLYHHENSMTESREVGLDVERHFVHDPARSVRQDFAAYLEARLIEKMHPWFFFSEFLDSWLQRPHVCVVRYEDMVEDPEPQLVRILRFLGHAIDLGRVHRVCEEMSFESQRKARYGANQEAGAQDNTKFLRRGKAGDWVNHFNRRSCELIWKLEGPSILRLGYEADAGWIASFLEGLAD